MLKNISRNQLVGFWFAGVAIIIAFAIVMGVNVGVSTTAVLLTLSLVPPGIIVALWGKAPPATIAEVLYETNARTEDRS